MDISLVSWGSDREATMRGDLPPTTTPATFIESRCDVHYIHQAPVEDHHMVGMIDLAANPNGRVVPLMAADSREIALSKASGPSTRPP